MISVTGETKLTYTLPTDIETAFNFYQDIHRILPYLPRIEFIKSYSLSQLQLCYVSKELNAYDVRIFCDVQAKVDAKSQVIRLLPLKRDEAVKARSGFNSTIAHGHYQSESYFYPEGNQTRLEYFIELAAELPKPWAVKIVPDSMMSSIATSIANHRINEIANGFIQKSVPAMAKWQANQAEASSS